jgi:hypothetical protein
VADVVLATADVRRTQNCPGIRDLSHGQYKYASASYSHQTVVIFSLTSIKHHQAMSSRPSHRRLSLSTHHGSNTAYVNGHGPRASNEASLQCVQNLFGYTTPVFKGKEEQRTKVQVDVAIKVLRLRPCLCLLGQFLPCHVIGIYSSRANCERGQLVLLPTRYRRHILPE